MIQCSDYWVGQLVVMSMSMLLLLLLLLQLPALAAAHVNAQWLHAGKKIKSRVAFHAAFEIEAQGRAQGRIAGVQCGQRAAGWGRRRLLPRDCDM
jgi:hypothetical protein